MGVVGADILRVFEIGKFVATYKTADNNKADGYCEAIDTKDMSGVERHTHYVSKRKRVNQWREIFWWSEKKRYIK